MEAIRVALHRSASVITEEIGQLRQRGYVVEESPAYGFRLSEGQGGLTADLLEYDLGTRRVGKKIVVYKSTDSTNDVAWHYAQEEGYDGLAVFAEHQRAGRGRLGRLWQGGEANSILCSILLVDDGDSEGQGGKLSGQSLTLLAGVSVAEAVESVCSISARIKWPNDVMADGKKLAGVMVEARMIKGRNVFVIGVGINCQQHRADFPVELQSSAVSLQQLTGRGVDQVQLAQQLLGHMDRWLARVQDGQGESLHDSWQSRCDDIGRRITVINDGQCFTGRVIDVGIEEGLILQLDGGGIKVFDGATTTIEKEED